MATNNNNGTHWHWTKDSHDIVWLGLDRADSSTNTLSREVLEELDACLTEISTSTPTGLVIYSGKDNGFIAGADVSEFTQIKDREEALALIHRGQDVFTHLEELSFPTVALINGFCLGGGMELALACRYRVADIDSARLGLPEVLLGIHPGFGGSVRLPPLIGAPNALDMMLTGRAANARRAAKIGLVDHAVPKRHMQRAACDMILHGRKPHTPGRLLALTNNSLVRPLLAWFVRRKVAQKARPQHYPAPYALIDLWCKHMGNPKMMMEQEALSVARLVVSDVSRNLVRAFFLQEQLKSFGKNTDNKEFHRVHVIGGGVMGGDIAAWCALRGLQVTIQDMNPASLARVMGRAYDLFNKKLKVPRLIQGAMDRLTPDLEGHGLISADVIIEAIFENVEAKQKLFRDIEPKVKKDALLATNTSSIPLDTLSEVLKDPSRLVGLHFFNPVAMMQLVEIITAKNTSQEVAAHAAVFTRKIDRLPLPVASSPGFLVNRILMPYLLEAVLLVEEGIPETAIDNAAVEFGMPMGPIELADTVGLDICLSVGNILAQKLGMTVPALLQQLVDQKRLGRKSGQGFYNFKNKKPVKPKLPKGYTPPVDLTDRLTMRLINEAAACLREGVVENDDLLDAGIIFGTGFAPFRGGPMHYAKQQQKDAIIKHLTTLEQRYGERFHPDAYWPLL